jgi:hypothetical protein
MSNSDNNSSSSEGWFSGLPSWVKIAGAGVVAAAAGLFILMKYGDADEEKQVCERQLFRPAF